MIDIPLLYRILAVARNPVRRAAWGFILPESCGNGAPGLWAFPEPGWDKPVGPGEKGWIGDGIRGYRIPFSRFL